MLKALRARAADEGGSVAVAVIAVVVASMVLLSMARSVESGLATARVDQNRINAFQHANAGIDLALYRIDRQEFTGGNVVTTADGFTDSVTVDGSTYDVVATRSTTWEGAWIVRSTGTEPSGHRRQVIATVNTSRLFDNGFFTIRDFNLTGNQSSPVAYDSRTCPTASLDCEILPVPSRIGTNARITGATATVEAFKARWSGFDMYGRATQAEADMACDDGGCGTAPKVAAIANQAVPEVPSVPDDVEPCPSGGNVRGGSIAAGDYVCDSLQLGGTVTIPGGYDDRVRIWVNGAFTLETGAVVNRAQPTPKLQIFQTGDPDAGGGNGDICNGELWALLYAPHLVIDCRGSHQPSLYGAVIAQFHDGRGHHFDFHYDVRASDVARDERYTITDWRECPASVTDC